MIYNKQDLQTSHDQSKEIDKLDYNGFLKNNILTYGKFQKDVWEFVLEGDNDGIWEHDLENDRMIISDKTKASFGYGEEDIYNKTEHWAEKIHPEDRDRVLDQHNKYLSGNSKEFRIEYRFRRKDGSYAWILIRGKIVRRDASGNPLVMVGTHSDITARKQAEEELRIAKLEAEHANLVKSQFLANMSHELRTPLTEIIGITDFLLLSDLNEIQREFLNIVKSSSEVLRRNINDILEYSKIEEGKITLENEVFNILEMIEETINFFRRQVRSKNIQLRRKINLNMPENVIGDSIRLHQVLANLIGNAIKFTPAGTILMDVDFEELNNNQTRYKFDIIDTGIGIEEKDLTKLFKRFSQINHEDVLCNEGIGLGLAISKGIVEMMGGRIGIQSQVGVGSRFYFDVVLDKADSSEY